MKIFKNILFCFIIVFNLSAEDKITNEDKLDALDQQSKEFFNAITGLEKDYLEEQITKMEKESKEKAKQKVRSTNSGGQNKQYSTNNNRQMMPNQEKVVSQEEIERNIFRHQTEMAQLTSNFAKTKQLQDIQIKSMYSFNGKNYVVLQLANKRSASLKQDELSSSIEGRYKRGDFVLGHQITSINSRTKSVKLYKKLDDEYGYYIYLSNYGITVSDLKKINQPKKVVKKVAKIEPKKIKVPKKKKSVSTAFKNVKIKKPKKLSKKEAQECLYTVKVLNLNVRNNPDLGARILRVLKRDDQFTIVRKRGQWVQLDTIYKKVSRDVMPVENKNNWLQIIDNNVIAFDRNCL